MNDFEELIATGSAADVSGWDFTVDRYRDRLRDLHDLIVSDGPFIAHSTRHLIEARRV